MDTTTDCSGASDCWRWRSKHCFRGRKIIIAEEYIEMNPSGERPSISDITKRFIEEVKGKEILLPKTKNKGGVGGHLEELLGIPRSQACWDCSDGELKTFPLKKLKRSGKLVPKETVAITMVSKNETKQGDSGWEQSTMKKKTGNMLFVSYHRVGDTITYLNAYTFGSESPQYSQLEADYEYITGHFKEHGIQDKGNTIYIKPTGYVQSRTKGGGKKKGSGKRTVAFYFMTKFIRDVILPSPSC